MSATYMTSFCHIGGKTLPKCGKALNVLLCMALHRFFAIIMKAAYFLWIRIAEFQWLV